MTAKVRDKDEATLTTAEARIRRSVMRCQLGDVQGMLQQAGPRALGANGTRGAAYLRVAEDHIETAGDYLWLGSLGPGFDWTAIAVAYGKIASEELWQTDRATAETRSESGTMVSALGLAECLADAREKLQERIEEEVAVALEAGDA